MLRRGNLFRSGALVVALAAAFPAAYAQPPDLAGGTGSDWPRFLGPTGDGKSPETSVKLKWPVTGPPVRWHREVGEGYSMPSVAGGRLFLFDRHGDRARLTCLDARTGDEIWRAEYTTDYEDYYDFSGGPKATPVVDGDRVYTFGVEGRLRCHRVTDGKLLWDVDTAERFGVVQNFFGVGSSPIVENDLLIVPVGGSPPDSPRIHSGEVRGNGSGIVAFDKSTGKVRYKSSDELASYASPAIVSLGDRRLGLWFARGGLVGFEPATGKVAFEFPWKAKKLESVNAGNPVIVGNQVLISEAYGPGSALLRIGSGKPEVIWQDPPRGKAMQAHWMTPIHHEGYVYGSSGMGSGNAELRAVEWATGKVMWSQKGLGRCTLLYVAGHFIVLTERGRLLVIEATPESYRRVSEATLMAETIPGKGEVPLIDYPAWGPPILAGGLLYVKGKDHLACIDLSLPAPD
jgi:outer membrane protein assembly factor BamB